MSGNDVEITTTEERGGRTRKRKLLAAGAVVTGAALLAAGGYAAVTSKALLHSGLFSVDADPSKPAVDDQAVLLANGEKDTTIALSLSKLKNNSTLVSHDDVSFTNGGVSGTITDLKLADVSLKVGATSTSNDVTALTKSLKVTFQSASDPATKLEAPLSDWVNGTAKFEQAVDLQKNEATKSDWTVTVDPDDDLTSAAGQVIDDVVFTFAGTGSNS